MRVEVRTEQQVVRTLEVDPTLVTIFRQFLNGARCSEVLIDRQLHPALSRL